MAKLTVRMLGTGTSTGVPVLTCDCAVCTSTDSRNRRTRTSALIRDETRSLLIDGGADCREQLLAARATRIDAVLLTHGHADHTAGLDDLRMFNFRQRAALPLFGNQETLDDIRKRFDYCFRDDVQEGGGLPQFTPRLVDGPFECCGLRVTPVPVLHGRLPVLGFRIGDFAYLTDASSIPEASYGLLGGVRTLVLNALRHRRHATHFSLGEAVEAARRIGAAQTWFTHMTHDLDHEATNRALPPNAQLAHDGLEFEIDAGPG